MTAFLYINMTVDIHMLHFFTPSIHRCNPSSICHKWPRSSPCSLPHARAILQVMSFDPRKNKRGSKVITCINCMRTGGEPWDEAEAQAQ